MAGKPGSGIAERRSGLVSPAESAKEDSGGVAVGDVLLIGDVGRLGAGDAAGVGLGLWW